MSEPAPCISVQDVYLKYRRGKLFKKAREFHAINGISFEVFMGDSLAIIGGNGAGKSTMLRLLANIIEPDKGKVVNHGVNVTLLALGAGVAPECTGRSNAVIQAMLQQNISRKKAEDLIPKVIKFAELEMFIDEPFKFYSDGMRARLNFAVATQIKSDVLLVDEIISVGDMYFREKSRKAMIEKFESGETVVVVSHDLDIVKRTCSRAIWLEKGKLKMDGPVAEVVDKYKFYWAKKAG